MTPIRLFELIIGVGAGLALCVVLLGLAYAVALCCVYFVRGLGPKG